MNVIKTRKSIILTLVVIGLVFSFTVFAQTPPATTAPPAVSGSISPQEYQLIQNLNIQISQLRVSDTNYTTVYNDLKQVCDNFGSALNRITNKKYIAQMVGDVTGKKRCEVGENPSGQPGGFKITNEANSFVQGIMYNGNALKTTPIDSQTVTKALDSQAQTNSFLSFIPSLVDSIITAILNIINTVMVGLVFFAEWLMQTIITQTLGPRVDEYITIGWTQIRDFMNMMFILALIVIALMTILRIDDKYNYKKLIPKLIMMALLINFSKVIATTLIDASDGLIRVFALQNHELSSIGKLANTIILNGKGAGGFIGMGESFSSVRAIFNFILGAMMTLTFLSFAGLLLLRMVGLWFLVIISPAAYALRILPNTEEYAKKWWSYFIKYLIWGPVAMFLMRLGYALFDSKGSTSTSGSPFDGLYIAAFFWFAFSVSKGAGMLGSGAVIGAAQSATKMASKYIARGSWAKHLGQGADFGVNKLTFGRYKGDTLGRWGAKLPKATSFVEGAPGYVKGKLDAAEKARQAEVSTSMRAFDRRFMKTKGLDKETAEVLNPEEAKAMVDELMAKVRSGDTDIDLKALIAVLKHGKEDTVNEAAKFVAQINDPKYAAAYKDVQIKVKQELWKTMGGSGHAPTDLKIDITNAPALGDPEPESKTRRVKIEYGKPGEEKEAVL